MSRFYTKTGDDGYTSLLGKGRVPKSDQQIETVGAIDEANAALGLARSLSNASETAQIILEVQKDLYHLMSEVAASPENASKFRHIDAERVSWIEAQIDIISSMVTIPSEFIIPGNSTSGAALDLARTVVRRAERQLAGLLHAKKLENRGLLHYMNRLSSLCFILELYEDKAAGNIQPTLAKS